MHLYNREIQFSTEESYSMSLEIFDWIFLPAIIENQWNLVPDFTWFLLILILKDICLNYMFDIDMNFKSWSWFNSKWVRFEI